MKRFFNQFFSLIEIALQRTWAARGSHAAIALGVLVATTTICALILYASDGGPPGNLADEGGE